MITIIKESVAVLSLAPAAIVSWVYFFRWVKGYRIQPTHEARFERLFSRVPGRSTKEKSVDCYIVFGATLPDSELDEVLKHPDAINVLNWALVARQSVGWNGQWFELLKPVSKRRALFYAVLAFLFCIYYALFLIYMLYLFIGSSEDLIYVFSYSGLFIAVSLVIPIIVFELRRYSYAKRLVAANPHSTNASDPI